MGADRAAMLAAAGIAFVLGLVTIAILEAPWFHPERAPATAHRCATQPAHDSGRRRELGSRPSIEAGERWEVMSTSTPRNDGATSGRSNPGTELGP